MSGRTARKASATQDEQTLTIAPAKGRPMLNWVGKRPLRDVRYRPAQHIETFDPTEELARPPADPGRWRDWPDAYPPGGLLFYGDNKEVLASLVRDFRGKVKLIYIDPPFDSGADYVRKVQLRGVSGLSNLEGEGQSLGEQVQYSDIWANDTYLQFMYERLILLKETLTDDGGIYLHCDDRKSHHLRCVIEEVFGSASYRNEIVWKRTTARSDSKTYNHIHDTLLYFAHGEVLTWNKQYLPYSEEYLRNNFRRDDAGRLYRETPLTAPGTRTGPSGQTWRGINPSSIGRGRHWAIPSFVQGLLSEEAKRNSLSALDELDNIGRIVWSREGQGRPNVVQYVDDLKGVELQSIWSDFGAISSNAVEAEEYPTQKPEALLERIIRASSNPGDIVLDCFIGSGTTAAVAQKLGRRWIGCDINKGAIQTTSRRLQTIIEGQIAGAARPKQNGLAGLENGAEAAVAAPAQLAFTLHRVNDYDLAIQHNEAVTLVCEQLGVTRTRTDPFFDGTLGSKLVKIVPFDHPLGPLDLEAVKEELAARGGEEQRAIALVCLGKQLAADDWLANWNRYRAVTKLDEANRPIEFVNAIEAIDLRTDPKYGGFIVHTPASAEVAIAREGAEIAVTIADFISPTIVERLKLDLPLFRARITDWRAMVNSVEIDTAYDGAVFNIAHSDIPEKKTDLVVGEYRLSAPAEPTTVAVKITDMLGEEVLVTREV